MKKILLLLITLVAGLVAHATLQTGIILQGVTRTVNNVTMCSFAIQSNWGGDQIPSQTGSSYTFSNATMIHGTANVTLNGTLNFQTGTSFADVITSGTFTVTIESSSLWFYGATVQTRSGTDVSGCSASVSSNNHTLTVTIPSGKTFGSIIVDYVSNPPISSSNTVISGLENSYLYLGDPIEPEPVVTYNGAVLTKDTDYTLSYWGSNRVGTAQLTVTGTGEYAGDMRKSYTIRKVALTDFNSLGNNTYEIATTTDLNYLALYISGNDYGSGITFKQTADIAYSYTSAWNAGNNHENNFTAIGRWGHSFRGTYDGQNHTISGIRIYKNDTTDYDTSQGLFGYISSGAIVKNVILADARITGYNNTGGIVGYNSGAIEDCRVESNVWVRTAKKCSAVGGIAGISNGANTTGVAIRRCTFKGTVSHGVTNSTNIGGIVGTLTNSPVSNCLALGAYVRGYDYSGAIAGIKTGTSTLTANYYHDCTVNNNVNSGASVNVGVGIGSGSEDQDGARSVHALTLPDGVTATGESVDIDGVTHYAAGTTVTLACSNVPEGYMVKYSLDGNAITGDTFTMPAADATVTVQIIAIDYSITLPSDLEHATVTSDKATAHIGDTVTLTFTPEDESYIVSSLTVMNGNSEVEVTAGENNTYTFVMPAANVTVNVEIQRLRYVFNSETGVLKLIYGAFNKDNKWGSDVRKAEVTSVTATNEVRFTGDCSDLFNGFTNCTSMDLSNVNTDSVTNMNCMFIICSALTSLDLSSWNTAAVTDMGYMFQLCSSLESLDLTGWNTANVTNMNSMFESCISLTTLEGISNWNTAAVTEMNNMFNSCKALTSLDLSSWNTAAVTEMGRMFYNCLALTTLDLSGWNTAAVTFMEGMFSLCSNLTTIEGISNWNTAEVTNMSVMFHKCSSLTSLDLSGWDTDKVETINDGTNGMFSYCSNLTSLNLTGWNMGNITDMRYMFFKCSSLTTLEGISGWDVSNVTDMHSMFYSCSSLGSLDLSGWNTSEVTRMNAMFYGCSNLATIYAGKEWNTENVTSSGGMFENCTSLVGGMSTTYDADHVDGEYARYDQGDDEPGYLTGVFTLLLPEDVTTTAVATLTHNGVNYYKGGSDITLAYNGTPPDGTRFYHFTVGGEPIDGDTFAMPFADAEIGVEYQARYTYDSTTGVLALNYGEFNNDNKWGSDVNPDNVTSVTATSDVSFTGDCSQLFYNFTNCTSIDLNNVNTSEMTSSYNMFNGCSSLTSLDLSGWNTASVTDMSRMFFDCADLTTLDLSGWNTGNVTDMSFMFSYNPSLDSLDLSGWNTGNVILMDDMFLKCTGLTTLNVSGWNTGNVTNMISMFSYCSKLEMLDLSGWNTANVTDINSMFDGCSSLTSLNLSGWNTGKVTKMNGMFYGCSSLTSLDLSGWNTASVTEISAMFMGCSSLDSLNLSGWNNTNVTYMDKLFSGCSSLTSLDLTNFETTRVNEMSNMFEGCSSLTSLDLSGWNTGNVCRLNAMFSGCSSLTSLNLSGWNVSNVTDMSVMFNGCSSLTALDVSGWNTSNVEYMNNMFSGCTGLTTLDLTGWNTSNVENMNNMFYGCTGLTTIYAGNGWSAEDVYLGTNQMFENCTSLVGGMGTTFDPNHTDGEYARYDHGDDEPGYLTGVFALTLPEYVITTAVATLTHNGVNLYAAGDTITLSYSGEVPEGYAPVYSVNGIAISGNTFTMPFEDATVTVEVQRLRYIYDSETHELALLFGPFNKNDKWGDDVPIDSVTSVTATEEVSFTDDCSYLFANFDNCESMDLSKVNTDNVTNMYGMFSICSSLGSLDLSSWNIANVTNMTAMFYGCKSLETFNLSTWDVSNVTDMGSMFGNCTGLTTLDLKGWDVSNVTNTATMFTTCSSLTALDVSDWIIGSANLTSMFLGCTGLTTLDLSTWDTSNVTDMNGMFINCSSLTTIYAGEGWSTENVTNSNSMFVGCTNLVGGMGTTYDENHIDGEYACMDRGGDEPGYLTGVFALTLPEDVTASPAATLTHGDENLYAAGSEVTLSYSGEVPEGYAPVYSVNGNAIQGDTFDMPFEDATVTVEVQRLRYIYDSETHELALLFGPFNKNDKWGDDVPIDSVTSVTATDQVSFTGDCGQLFTNFTNCISMDLSLVNTDSVTVTAFMFGSCSSLETLNLSGWNTGNVTNMAYMFATCHSLTTIEGLSDFDTGNLTIMTNMFFNCRSLETLDLSSWNTGNVTNMSNMFGGCTSLQSLNLSGWDVSEAPNMKLMFNGCSSLTTLDVSDWTIGSANFINLFLGCTGIRTLDLSTWNTSGVIAMHTMFQDCSNLTTIYVGEGWSTESVTNTGSLFGGCTSLVGGMGTTFDPDHIGLDYAHIDGGPDNPGYLTEKLPRYTYNPETGELALIWGEFNKDDKWGDDVPIDSVTSVTATDEVSFTGDCSQLFRGFRNCTSMDLSKVNTDSVTSMGVMFAGCSSLNSLDISSWNTANVTNMAVMFQVCQSLETLDISSWDVSNVTDMGVMFYGCTSLETLNLKSWDVSNVTSMGNMFNGCSSLTALDVSNWNIGSASLQMMFLNCTGLTTLDLSTWDTSNVTNMGNMFTQCSSLTTLDLSSWDTGNVTNMGSMFAGSANLTTIYVGEGWTTENVTSSGGMFGGCTSLVGGMGTTYDADHTDAEYAHIDGGPENPGYFTEWRPRYTFNPETGVLALNWGEFNKDDKWGDDVPAEAVTSVTATSDVSFTGDCSELFYNFKNCTSMDLNNVNTDSVTSMSGMFSHCNSLTSLDLSGWNTNSVTDMSYMFYICENLETLDVSGFDTGNVTNMSSMFNYCKSLESLDVSGFDTGNVTDMSDMFRECQSLEVLDVSGFDTGNVTDMNAMFCGCIALETLDVTGFDTGNVTDMSAMFIACKAFETLDVTGFNTSNVTDMNNMFAYCENLCSIDLSNFDTSNVTNMFFLFCGDTNLTTIYVGEGWTTENVTESFLMFNECTSLVGGMGTTYDANHIDAEYAHIDGGTENPGYFTAAMTSITLAEMLENGVDGENYIISDDLAVVDRNEATGQYFVSDGNGNWIAINAGDFYNNELASLKGGFVKGTLGGMDLNPYFTLSAAPVEGEDVEPVEPTEYSLANEFAPKVNEVIIVKKAYYKASENALRAYAPGNGVQGQSLTVDTSFGDFDFVDGQAYDVQGVINIKEPWSAKAGLMDYDFPFQNYMIKATGVEEIDPVTDINGPCVDYGSDIVNVYNAKGQLIKSNVKASEATQGLPRGVYIIGNKKVYVE